MKFAGLDREAVTLVTSDRDFDILWRLGRYALKRAIEETSDVRLDDRLISLNVQTFATSGRTKICIAFIWQELDL